MISFEKNELLLKQDYTKDFSAYVINKMKRREQILLYNYK